MVEPFLKRYSYVYAYVRTYVRTRAQACMYLYITVLEEKLLEWNLRHFAAKYSLKINSREKYHPAIFFGLQFLTWKEEKRVTVFPSGGIKASIKVSYMHFNMPHDKFFHFFGFSNNPSRDDFGLKWLGIYIAYIMSWDLHELQQLKQRYCLLKILYKNILQFLHCKIFLSAIQQISINKDFY